MSSDWRVQRRDACTRAYTDSHASTSSSSHESPCQGFDAFLGGEPSDTDRDEGIGQPPADGGVEEGDPPSVDGMFFDIVAESPAAPGLPLVSGPIYVVSAHGDCWLLLGDDSAEFVIAAVDAHRWAMVMRGRDLVVRPGCADRLDENARALTLALMGW